MKLRRDEIESRAAAVGLSAADIKECFVHEYGGGWWEVNVRHPSYPRRKPPKPGLGDMVAGALSAVGITKERVSKAIGKPCGCAKRQERLNELGRRLGIG
jgi:hypothetical protein